MCLLSCRLHRPEQNVISMVSAANMHCETKHYLEFFSPKGFIWRQKQGQGEKKGKQEKLT